MRAILYNPADHDMVLDAGLFLEHLTQCPNCRAFAQTDEGRAGVAALVARLDSISGEDLTVDNLPAVIEFCLAWLNANENLKNLDTLMGEFVSTYRDSQTQH